MASSTDECDPRAAAVPAPRPARVFGMDLGAAGRAPGRGAGVVAAGLAGRPAAAGRRPPGLPLGCVAAALGDVRAGAVASSGHRQARVEIGRAPVCTPVTNAQLVCRPLLEK